MKIKLSKLGYNIFVYVVLGFTVIVSIFPIIWIIVSSFKTNAQILGSPFSLPTGINLVPYKKVFTQYNFLTYTFNSLIISSVATAISVIFYAMAAYVIAKYDFRFKNLFYVLFTMTLLVPGQTKAQPIFTIILKLHLYDTRLALILVYLSMGMAMSLFILRGTFMSIPKEFDESASIEGAGFLRVFLNINLPLAKSGLATAGVLMFLNYWNEYFYAMLLTSSAKVRTLPLEMGFFNEAFSYNYTEMFAALTIAVLPGIIIYSCAQEQVQESVVSSGIKG